MKAWVQSKPGPFHDTVSLQESFELPKITTGDQVLVRNYACSINPVDHKRGTLFASVCPFPSTSGCDGAGIVLDVGLDVDEAICKVGDAIYYHTSIFQPYGTFATHSIVNAAAVCRLPAFVAEELRAKEKEQQEAQKKEEAEHDKIEAQEEETGEIASPAGQKPLVESLAKAKKILLSAAAAPCCAWTGALALWEHGLNLNENDEFLFVRGGSGGTGSLAIALAKKSVPSCKVIATCSTKNVDFVKKAVGADFVIDYTKNKVTEEVLKITNGKGVSKYLDCVSTPEDDVVEMMSQIISFNGAAAFLLPFTIKKAEVANALFGKQVRLINILLGSFMTNPATAKFVRPLVERCHEYLFPSEKGKEGIYIPISEIFKLDGIPFAIQHSQSGKTVGKTVVEI